MGSIRATVKKEKVKDVKILYFSETRATDVKKNFRGRANRGENIKL